MTRVEWAVLLAVLCHRGWEHSSWGQGPVVNLWRSEYGTARLSLVVPEVEAP